MLSRTLREAKVFFSPESFARLLYLYLIYRYSIDYIETEMEGSFITLSSYRRLGDGVLMEGGQKDKKRILRCNAHQRESVKGCSDCDQVAQLYQKEVRYKFPAIPRVGDQPTSIPLLESLRIMVQYFTMPKTDKQLNGVLRLVAAGSGAMIQVKIPHVNARDYKVHFRPPPGIRTDVLSVLMEYNSRRSYPDVHYVRIDDRPSILCPCGYTFDAQAMAYLINLRSSNAPPPCPRCGNFLRLDSQHGVFGFHEAWCSGHSMDYFPKLLSYFSHQTLDQPREPEYWTDLSFAIKTMHTDCTFFKYKSVMVPDFRTDCVVDDKMTAPGVIKDLPRCYKKHHVAQATKVYIEELAEETSFEDRFDSKMKIVSSKIPNVAQCAIKAEVKCGKVRIVQQSDTDVGMHQYYTAPGERMFFVVHIVLSTILRMIYGIFASCGGIGTETKNMPIAIGMSFFGGSAQAFASEMFRRSWDSLTLTIPHGATKLQMIEAKDALEKSILDKVIIVEWDVQKWDMNMLASLLANVARSFGAFYDIGVDTRSQVFLAFFLRVIECHKFKAFNCPSGSGWFGIAAAMMSGSWDTSFMNSACNYVAQIVVLKQINPEFFARKDWRDHLTIKVFGDDALACFSRDHWTVEQLKRIPDVMKKTFRFTIPVDDFKIHTKIVEFAHIGGHSFDRKTNCDHEIYNRDCQTCEGRYDLGDYPTFLKFRWILVYCPRCSNQITDTFHWSFAREGYKVLPKLFVDSTKPLTLQNLHAKLIGYLYTVGVTPSIYCVIRELVEILIDGGGSDVGPQDMDEIFSQRFGLNEEWWKLVNLHEVPQYKTLIDRMVCPFTSGAPLFGTDVPKNPMPVVRATKKYADWDEYRMGLGKITTIYNHTGYIVTDW